MSQCMDALEKANHVRIKNAEIAKEIGRLPAAEGRERVAQLLEDPPPEVASMPLRRLVLAPHRMGVVRMHALIKRCEIVTAEHRVGELTDRQRRTLAHQLRALGIERWKYTA